MCRASNLLQTALVLHLGCSHYSQYDSALCRISFLNARCDYASDQEKDEEEKEGKRVNDEEREVEEEKAQSEKDLWNSRKEALNIT